MNRSAMRSVVGYLSYRPNSKIYVEGDVISIELITVSSEDGRDIRIGQKRTLPADDYEGGEQDFLRWVLEELIMPFERHEAEEWFKLKDRRIFEAH